jgi:hypothetical protein
MERKTLIWTALVLALGAVFSLIAWYMLLGRKDDKFLYSGGGFIALLSLSFLLLFYKIWPRSSLSNYTFEPYVFSAQFLFQIAWAFAVFFLNQPIPSVIFLLFLWSATLFAIFLYWKREGFSGYIENFPILLLGTIYFVSLGALTCMFTG